MLCDSIFSSGMYRVVPTKSEPSVYNTKYENQVVFFQLHPNASRTRIHNTNKVPYKTCFSDHIPSYYCYDLPLPYFSRPLQGALTQPLSPLPYFFFCCGPFSIFPFRSSLPTWPSLLKGWWRY